jgi:hypothetical protein
MRAFQGLTQQLQQLRINLNWWDLLQKSVGETLLQQARNLVLPSVNVATTEFKTLDFAAQAKKLHVKITQNNQPLVSIELPAEAALDLKNLIPNNVRLELEQTGVIDLTNILQHLKSDGLRPQTLFSCEIGEKNYRVWLV